MNSASICTGLIVAASILNTSVANAQPGMSQPQPVMPTQPQGPALAPTVAQPLPPSQLKSEGTATALALAGSALPFVLFIAASNADYDTSDSLATAGFISLIFTPSMGHWYSGKIVTVGMGLRAAGSLATIVGVASALGCAFTDSEGACDGNGGAALLVLGGLGAVAAGVIYDIATADNAARDYNASHAPRMTIAPTMAKRDGATETGLAVFGAF